VSELTREDHWCRMGLLAGAAIHWIVAGIMAWQWLFPMTYDSSMPTSGRQVAWATLASALGIA
jgi:hypothetical protein